MDDLTPSVITWAHVFNANDRTLADAAAVAAQARACGYGYFAHLCRLWSVTFAGADDLGVSSDHLAAGVEVRTHPDGRREARPADNTVFVVVERAFEYDDETYRSSDGGWPKRVYLSQAEAEAACAALGALDAVNVDLFEFFDEYSDEYDNIVRIPWPMWLDWLTDKGVPTAHLPSAEEKAPVLDQLKEWWLGLNDPQKTTATESIHLPFYEWYRVRLEG